MEWKEGWKLSRRLSVDITVESARYGTSKKEKQGKGIERQEYVRTKERGRRGQERLERSAGYEISYACLSVRLNLRAHQQPPTSKKNLAERRIPLRRNDGGKGRG